MKHDPAAGTVGGPIEVILTHEHADFDAVAAMVGLARLQPAAIAVLPQTVNNNVGRFLRLYGHQLPLVPRESFPAQRIEHVWIVDARQVKRLPGMTQRTRRTVLDHHPFTSGRKSSRTCYEVANVGATSTMIVERMQAHSYRPSTIDATMLLLGIYEDTGCLTYRQTTPRDLHAAAWLIEAGADLGAVGEFLTYPLSARGEATLSELLRGAELLTVCGQQIVIASAQAHGVVDETATFARRLMDLLEPQAAFVLLDLGSRIQLVARSTTDIIDVGRIGAMLGGGGHARAAAAALSDLSLEEAAQRVRDLLLALTPQSGPMPSHRNTVAQRVDLARQLPADVLMAVRQVAEVGRRRGEATYLVGGLPRDLLLGRPHGPDIDIVVEGDAEGLASALAEHFGGQVRVHRRFGTAKWIQPTLTIDIVTARSEYYTRPTALPEVQPGCLASDLRRRDFTINAIAIDLHPERFGAIVDPFGGVADLRAGRIRVLHDLSFVDDPTRILRALRLAQRLGFTLDPGTEALIPQAVKLIGQLSGARILAELSQLWREPDPQAILDALGHLGALEAIQSGLRPGARVGLLLDALPAVWAFWRRMAFGKRLPSAPSSEHSLLVWMTEQDPAVAMAAAERLGLAKRWLGMLRVLLLLRQQPGVLSRPNARASEVVQCLGRLPPESIVLAWLTCDDALVRAHLRRYGAELAAVEPNIRARDLLALGLPRGPILRVVLDAVRAARLDGEVHTRAEEINLARRIAADHGFTAGDES